MAKHSDSTFLSVIDRFDYILLTFQTVDFWHKICVKLNLFSHNFKALRHVFGLILCCLVSRRSLTCHQPQVSCGETGKVVSGVGLHVWKVHCMQEGSGGRRINQAGGLKSSFRNRRKSKAERSGHTAAWLHSGSTSAYKESSLLSWLL